MIQNTTIAGPTIFPVSLLISLRWIAIGGQTFTVFMTDVVFGYPLPLFTVSCVIGLSILVNLILMLFTSRNGRIPASQMFYYLIYDLGQLGALLFLTGGLNNPFCLFILVPVVIASGFSTYRNGLIISATAIIVVMILALSPYALPWEDMGDHHGLVLPERLQLCMLMALVIAILFISLYTGKIAAETRTLSRALCAAEGALTREQRLASLGALAAAAAHELGSPLTTIMLIAKDLEGEKTLPSVIQADLSLILQQAYRCRDILGELAKNCAGEKQAPYEVLPLTAAIHAVVQMNHKKNSVEISIVNEPADLPEPVISLSPELMHGLTNIIQNARQFCATLVEINIEWTANTFYIVVRDDGPGYPLHLLDRLGEPYTSGRFLPIAGAQSINLGLGLFIAKTLLAQKGARLHFHNDGGAVCTIEWEYKNEHSNEWARI